MSGSGAFVLVVLLFALVIPIALWLAIESETSDPTVVDRAEAERIATERGGRTASRSDDDPTAGTAHRRDRDGRPGDDDRPREPGAHWGRGDDEWGEWDRDRR